MAVKMFNRTVEQINPLLDKLDALPYYPVNYKGEVVDYSDLPEEPTQGDCYLVSFETGTEHVANRLYYYSGTTWKEIAVDGYTKYEIDQMVGSLSGGVHWLGAVNYYSSLPSDASLGDAYTVLYEGSSGTDPCGDEYVWGTLNNTDQWILFGKETYTKAQIDDKLAGKQDTIDSSHKISADNVDDTSATHKFATSAQLTQIETNKNNILLSEQMNGAKNFFDFANATITNIRCTMVKSNTSLTTTSDGNYAYAFTILPLKAGNYVFSCTISARSGSNNTEISLRNGSTSGAEIGKKSFTTNDEITIAFTLSNDTDLYIIYYTANGSQVDATTYTASNNMIITKEAYDAGFTDYQPYALPNTTITPALQECVDNGSKNKLDFANIGSPTASHVTYTKTNTDITCTSNGAWAYILLPFSLNSGAYNLSFTVSNYSKSGGAIRVTLYTDSSATSAVHTIELTGNGNYNFDFAWTGGALYLGIYVNQNGTSYANTVTLSKVMICTEAEYNASQTYQPYAMSNVELTEKTQWAYQSNANNTTVADTWSYTGLSFDVTANSVYQLIASDRTPNCTGIAIADNNTDITTATSIIGITTVNISDLPVAPWQTCVHAITPKYNSNLTFYVWVRRNAVLSNVVSQLAAQRII